MRSKRIVLSDETLIMTCTRRIEVLPRDMLRCDVIYLFVVGRWRVENSDLLVLAARHKLVSIFREAAAENLRVESHKWSLDLVRQVQVIDFASVTSHEGAAAFSALDEINQWPLAVSHLIDLIAETWSAFDLIVQWTLLSNKK